jgi:hypothetical protein
MTMLESGNDQVLTWKRTAPNGAVAVVACSFSSKPQTVSLQNAVGGTSGTTTVLADSYKSEPSQTVDLGKISLPAFGALVAEIK